MGFFKEKLHTALQEYNKYRAPEAIAELVQVGDNWFTVFFKGSFCYSCGVYDYIDDLRVLLEDFELKTCIEHLEERDEGILVTFTVEDES